MEVERLKGTALNWATFLFALRDGQPGSLQKVVWNPWTWGRAGKVKVRHRSSRVLVARIVPVSNAARELPKQFKSDDWVLFRPVMPKPQVWEHLKRAHSVKEIREVARSMSWWAGGYLPGGDWAIDFPRALHSHAEDVLKAKRLPNYPKSNRPRSDDKRVEFFAKILAGLMHGIAPATATKRLTRWNYPEEVRAQIMSESVPRVSETSKEERQ